MKTYTGKSGRRGPRTLNHQRDVRLTERGWFVLLIAGVLFGLTLGVTAEIWDPYTHTSVVKHSTKP